MSSASTKRDKSPIGVRGKHIPDLERMLLALMTALGFSEEEKNGRLAAHRERIAKKQAKKPEESE